ncbi:MAG: hypothetical protein EGR94_01380 [Blautia obeum]|nr:hypothetical protein [Blautia obeum]
MKKKHKVRRAHKDRLFCNLFSQKENALALYNAINETTYECADELDIITLEDTIYLTMKNDVALCFHETMNLWEQQSTINCNMPIRGLMYFAREYEGWLAKNEKDIYGRKQVKIPTPGFYVFYNGEDPMPERREYHLTDAFEHPAIGYEWTAYMININAGNNIKLMKQCEPLFGYSKLIDYIRENQRKGCSIETAVRSAIDQCIEKNILKSYLLKSKGEVMSMILTEYNEKLHNKTLREEGWEEGWTDGENHGRIVGMATAKKIFKLYLAGKTDFEIAKATGLDVEEVKKWLE